MGREGRGGQQPVPRYMVPFMLVQRGGGEGKAHEVEKMRVQLAVCHYFFIIIIILGQGT